MTFATYTYMGPVGDYRGGVKARVGGTLWVVLHTSEGGEGLTSAEGLANFMKTPGDPSPGGNVASYQEVTDTDRVIRMMDDEKRANGAAGANELGLHICIPGKARQTRAEWLDPISAAYIEQAARATADWCKKYEIPVRRVFAMDMRKNVPGITDHNQVRLAFGKTTHTDVGPAFPWDVFMARVVELLAPAPIPPFDPAGRQYSLWPLVKPADLPDIAYGSRSDAVLYLKGVMFWEAQRFAKWFAAHGLGSTPDQAAALNYFWQPQYCPIDGSNPMYDEATVHAVYWMQQAFNYSAYPDSAGNPQHIGGLELDGTVKDLTWNFIQHIADKEWY